MNQSFNEIIEGIAQDVTSGFVDYIQIIFDMYQGINADAAEGPNLTPYDGKEISCRDCILRTEEVLARLRSVIWQLGTLLPIAQYTGQNAYEPDTMSEPEPQEAISRFLDKQLEADHYSNWLEVATSEFATSKHLKRAAKLCAGINNNDSYRKQIAEAIATHPAANDEALLPLCDSSYYSTWLIAAQSKHAGKKTLTQLGYKCATIDNSFDYRNSISKALANNATADDETILALCGSEYYSVWLNAASSPYAGDLSLRKLAQLCAGIKNGSNSPEAIAQALANNPNERDKLLLPLCDSRYFTVWEITAKSQYAGKLTLSKLATQCAQHSSDSNYVYRTAKAIAFNPRCTIDVLALMAGAHSERVSHIAHERMRDLANA